MKNICRMFLCLLAMFGLLSTPVLAVTPRYNVHPYSFSISEKSKTVQVGDEFSLKASGLAVAVGKTTWTVTDSSVIQLTGTESGSYGLSNGYKANFVALKAGKTTVIVKNNKNSDTLVCTVTVEEKKTTKPIITSAVSSGTSKAGKIKLEWAAVDGAKQYRVQISKNANFSNLFKEATTSKTSYNAGWNYYNQVGFGKIYAYYCRVKAVMDGTESEWSDTVICEQE